MTTKKNYQYNCLIPFHLCDPAGILFYAHVFTLYHQAFEHFIIEELHVAWEQWFENTSWIVPIKHTEADYFYPIKAGTNCRIEFQEINVSNCSFTITAHFRQLENCCTVKTTHVFCDRNERKKIPIPSNEIAQRLNQLISLNFS